MICIQLTVSQAFWYVGYHLLYPHLPQWQCLSQRLDLILIEMLCINECP